MDGLWEKTSERVRDKLGQVGYETWICPLNFLGLKGKTAVIEAPNRFFRDWVQDRYFEVLRNSLAAEAGEELELKITVSEHNGNGHHERRRPADQPAGELGRRCVSCRRSAVRQHARQHVRLR